MPPPKVGNVSDDKKYDAKLSIREYADYELLHVIDDNQGASTYDLAQVLEAETRSVGVRLSWMKRMALLGRTKDGGWTIARRGRALLERGGQIEQVRNLAKDLAGDPVTQWVARRETRRVL